MGYKWNTDNLRLLSNTLNISVNDEYHVGYTVRHDGEKFEKLKWHLAKTTADKDFFLRGNTLAKYLVIGHTHLIDGKLNAIELKYDVTGENAGLFGSHVEIKAAKTIKPSENITLINRLKVGSEVHFDLQWIQKVNENLDLHFNDTINLSNVFLNPAKQAYNFGLKFDYHF